MNELKKTEFSNFVSNEVIKKALTLNMMDEIIKECEKMKELLKKEDEMIDIFQKMKSIIYDDSLEWEEKFQLVFSNEISNKIYLLVTSLDYYDPDSGYQDDTLAFYQAVKEYLKL